MWKYSHSYNDYLKSNAYIMDSSVLDYFQEVLQSLKSVMA